MFFFDAATPPHVQRQVPGFIGDSYFSLFLLHCERS